MLYCTTALYRFLRTTALHNAMGECVKALELIGYAASVLVFITFYMKAMLPLRYIGLCSNVGFLIYGYLGGMYPVLVLHALLLPLNAVRVIELHRLMRQVRLAQRADISVERLLPH